MRSLSVYEIYRAAIKRRYDGTIQMAKFQKVERTFESDLKKFGPEAMLRSQRQAIFYDDERLAKIAAQIAWIETGTESEHLSENLPILVENRDPAALKRLREEDEEINGRRALILERIAMLEAM